MVLLYNAGLILEGPSPIFLQGKSQTFSNGGFTQLHSSMYKKNLKQTHKASINALYFYILCFRLYCLSALAAGRAYNL